MTKRILVVEDSRTQAEQLKAVLEGAGYVVEVAPDGETGCTAVDTRPPDAVISDIVMPGTVDGYELCRRTKAGPHREVPVILLTSLSDPTDIICALECGADNFLRKPYDPVYLLERLRVLFATREIRAKDRVRFGMKVLFMGREVNINAEHQQVLDLLISTFEEAVIQNRELRQREEELRIAKAELDRYAGALEQRLKSVLETIPDALFSVDPSLGNLFYISPGAEHVFGYRPEEMVGDPQLWRRSVHPDDLAAVLNTFSQAVDSGAAQTVECRFKTRAGGWRWIQLSVAAVSANAHGRARLDGVAQDVTDRKQAEQALLSSETRFRSLIEHSMDQITILGADGRFAYASPSVTRLLGYGPNELLGCVGFEYVQPDDVARVQAAFARAMGGDTAEIREVFRFRHKDGSWRAFESVVTNLLGEPTVAGLVVNSRDITDRTRAEEALRRSEAEHRGLVEHAPLGVYRSTRAGRFLMVNAALVSMLGYDTADEVLRLDIGRHVYADPEERERLIREAPPHVEVEWKRRDGTRITVQVSSRAIPGPEGQGECFEGMVQDITEQRSLENQFRQAQRLEAVGRLAGGVAHDFNNVLTAITGYSDLVLEDLGPEDPKRADLLEIRAAAQRAAGLTRQLLAFSRKQVLQTRVLDLNAVVRMLEKMLQRLIGEDVKLECALADGLGAVRADPGQLEQVILNLAVNSRDAMPGGGRLTLETANVELGEDYVRVHAGARAGRYVMLAVSDTGSGMDAETQSHIFEPFFTTKDPGKGTGLGLATVYGIVRQSDGYVWVYSEPGRGTTFKIYLPVVDEPVETQEPAPTVVPAPAGHETVLVAEDDPAVREIVTHVLTQRGYRVLRAPDGQTALELARAQAGGIELLVTDIVMPGMTGRELAEALAADHPRLRVLYMSGYTDDAVVRHGVLAEGLPYLQKPFTPAALAAKVREALDRTGAAAAL